MDSLATAITLTTVCLLTLALALPQYNALPWSSMQSGTSAIEALAGKLVAVSCFH